MVVYPIPRNEHTMGFVYVFVNRRFQESPDHKSCYASASGFEAESHRRVHWEPVDEFLLEKHPRGPPSQREKQGGEVSAAQEDEGESQWWHGPACSLRLTLGALLAWCGSAARRVSISAPKELARAQTSSVGSPW